MSLQDYRKETDYCTYCPKMCRFSCPVAETELRETVTPTGKQTIVHLVREGALPLDESAVEIFFKCTGCLHCQDYCLHGIDVPRSLEAARTHAYREGKTLQPVFQIAESMRRYGNPLGRHLLPELRKLAPASYFERKSGTLLYPGVHLITEKGGQGLRKTIAALEALGVSDLALPSEELLSAGMESLDCGDREGFAAHAQKVRQMVEPFSRILAPAPENAHAFVNRYSEVGQPLGERVVNFPDFLLAALEKTQIELRPVSKKKVTYHDPCVLTRRLKTTESPRKILALCGVEVEEAAWHGQDANCCGAGGGYADVFPEEATKMARGRLKECVSGRGGTVVTASPRCESHLRGAAGEDGAVVMDIVEIVAEALGVG